MLYVEWVGVLVTADGALLRSRSEMEVELALTESMRRVPDGHELWQALVLGHVRLEERLEDGRRHYLVLQNEPAEYPLRALTRRELDTIEHAAQGMSTKLIAYTLGVATPSVSLRLARAASKLGLATRSELVRLSAMLTRDPHARMEEPALTRVEREILQLVRDGLSNRAIAERRGRSTSTIANQIARLLRKTNAGSRRGLLTRH